MPLSFSSENMLRPWTLKYAKDGDVLVCEGCEYLLFKSFSNTDGRIKLYCWYNGQTNSFFHNSTDSKLRQEANIYPATKEQRDLLFQEMKDEGYEWDAENKKLKKIKQKSIRSEEELTDFEALMLHIGQSFFGENAGLNPNDIKIVKEQANLLIGLIEHKSAWSEEDIKAFNRICAILVDASEVKNWWKEYRLIEREEMIRLTDFLKSLQHQPHWKPSEEQIDALKEAVYQLDGTEYSNGIDSLYNDLKNRIKLE